MPGVGFQAAHVLLRGRRRHVIALALVIRAASVVPAQGVQSSPPIDTAGTFAIYKLQHPVGAETYSLSSQGR